MECLIGVHLIYSWGFGIDFEHDHFYNHWKKHYRYRAPTANRKLTIELSIYTYIISKGLILNDYFCYSSKLRVARLAAPRSPTKGEIGLDYGYLTALLEQDSVANLRYGILFLLALSSLGVYSIILAG